MDDFDLATQNTINHYRNKLHDIHTWHQQLNDTMTTITSHTMNLAPTTHTPTPRLEASWVWFRFFYGPVLMGWVR